MRLSVCHFPVSPILFRRMPVIHICVSDSSNMVMFETNLNYHDKPSLVNPMRARALFQKSKNTIILLRRQTHFIAVQV